MCWWHCTDWVCYPGLFYPFPLPTRATRPLPPRGEALVGAGAAASELYELIDRLLAGDRERLETLLKGGFLGLLGQGAQCVTMEV